MSGVPSHDDLAMYARREELSCSHLSHSGTYHPYSKHIPIEAHAITVKTKTHIVSTLDER